MVWPIVRPVRPGRIRGAWRGSFSTRLGIFAVVLAVCLIGGGCTSSDPARAGAERFIDRYYVEIDLSAAREHAVDYAVVKLDREMELLEGIDAPESGGKPQVNYSFLEERAGSDANHRGFLYELTITFGGGGQVVRRALVTVQNDGGTWRVANFQELD